MSPSCGVGVEYALFAADNPSCGEVRSGEALDDVLKAALRVFNDKQQSIADLGDVVWREVCSHSDGDTGRAVNQKVWVTVLDVDLERKRISLSMKDEGKTGKNGKAPKKKMTEKKAPRSKKSPERSFFNNPFEKALRGRK